MASEETLRSVEQRLVSAAATGLQKKDTAASGATWTDDTLLCSACLDVLEEPVTLGTGDSVCRECVTEVSASLQALCFGENQNLTLSSVLLLLQPGPRKARLLAQSARKAAAELRFKAAIDFCNQGLRLYPFSLHLHMIRAEALLFVEESSSALMDTGRVLALLRSGNMQKWAPGPGREQAEKELLAQALSLRCKVLLQMERKEEAVMCAVVEASLLATMLCEEISSCLQEIICEHENIEEIIGKMEGALLDGSFLASSSSALEEMGPATWQTELREQELEELEAKLACPLCMTLLYRPTTLACGHCLCTHCLARTLDHAQRKDPACPLCRFNLRGYLRYLNVKARRAPQSMDWTRFSHTQSEIMVTHHLDNLLHRRFPAKTAARKKQVELEESATALPIFFCSVAIPGAPCNLHIFEPRYRLMMRRCMESGDARFGMVPNPALKFGTVLKIECFKQLEDVFSTGERRFEVEGEYGEKDGYSVAKVKWIEYIPEPKDRVERLAHILREAIRRRHSRFAENPSSIPTDPEELVYWVLRHNVLSRAITDTDSYSIAFSPDSCQSLAAQLRYLLFIDGTQPKTLSVDPSAAPLGSQG